MKLFGYIRPSHTFLLGWGNLEDEYWVGLNATFIPFLGGSTVAKKVLVRYLLNVHKGNKTNFPTFFFRQNYNGTFNTVGMFWSCCSCDGTMK